MHKKLNGEKLKIEFEKLNEKHFDQIIAMMNSDLKIEAEKCPELLEINDEGEESTKGFCKNDL